MSAVDPLDQVLALVRPEAAVAAELHAHGRWHVAFDGYPGVKFGVVLDGTCHISIRGRASKVLRAGDVFLLGGQAYAVASDLRARPRSGMGLLSGNNERVVTIGRSGGQPSVHLLGGRFALDLPNAHLLQTAIPSLLCIPAAQAGALRGVTELLVAQVRAARAGRLRALDQLAQLLLVYALRWLESHGTSHAPHGWLRALTDPRIGAAVRHIHASVAAGTSLAELAEVAGMSRTAFVSRFKALVGKPPLGYAIEWRMSLAKDALRATTRPIGALAFELGYESESAFSMAFRREVGCSPRAYRMASVA